MTWIRVDPEEVAAVGAALVGVADELGTLAQDPHQSAGVAPTSAVYGPLHELLSHWELRRRRLGAAAADLATRATQVGGAYRVVEDQTTVDLIQLHRAGGEPGALP